MFEFFDVLLGYVEFIFAFLFGIVDSLLNAIVLLSNIVNIPLAMAGVLPGLIGAGVLCSLAILVVRFIALK